MPEPTPARHGILVVDKPSGCTSHDIVQRVRKAWKQRSVGHAGTLDPLATGVLVLAVGEGTKLISHLQLDDKRYEVTIALGAETDSLDADGRVMATAEVPPLVVEDVERALAAFVGRHPQEAPRLSAIKLGGTPLHRRVRRGEDVRAPVREVDLYEVAVDAIAPDELRLRLHCGKGFYVRSLARDLARALGTMGHVKSLRRITSGRFQIEDAVGGDVLTAEAMDEGLIPLSEACAVLRRVDLNDKGAADARHGRLVGNDGVVSEAWKDADEEESLAFFGPDGQPVALGRREGDQLRVVRGFQPVPSVVVSE